MRYKFYTLLILAIFSFNGCGSGGDGSDIEENLTRPDFVQGVSDRNIKYWGDWKNIKSNEDLYIISNNSFEIEQIEDDIIKIDSDYYLRSGLRFVNLKGAIYLPEEDTVRQTKALSPYSDIGNIEVYLQNILDPNINETVKTDENGFFESKKLPAGNYHMEITKDGIITRSDITLTLDDENLGRFKLVSDGSANFKVILGSDSEIFYGDGSKALATLRIKNIGQEIGKGLNYKISLNGSKTFNYENVVGSITPNGFKDIKIEASFDQQFANIKNYTLLIEIFDATGQKWNEEITIPVYKGYFTLKFKANKVINGILTYPNGKTEDFNSKNKIIKLPLSKQDSDYKLYFTNYGNIENETFYTLSSNAELKNLSSLRDTSAYEPNDNIKNAHILNEKDSIASYLHIDDIDYWRISSKEDTSKTFENMQNIKPTANIGTYWSGETLNFDFSKSFDDEKIITYSLESSLDGEIYSGKDSKFSSNSLTEDSHEFTLTVTDRFKAQDSQIITVDISERNRAPVSVLYFEDREYKEGDEVLFDMSDSSDDKTIIRYKLYSSIDGMFYESTYDNNIIKYSKLSAGHHKIKLTVFDEVGLSGEISSEINIIGEKPIANFTYCKDENISTISSSNKTCFDLSSFSENSKIIKYTVSSSIDGELHSGVNSKLYTKLSLGKHTLTLNITAKNGLTDSTTLEVEVKSFDPISKITTWKDSYQKGSIIDISGKNSKDIDGYISKYIFTSSIDGELYSGTKTSIQKYLSVGIHEINLTVIDNESNENTSSVQIEILNEKPIAKLNLSKYRADKGDLIYLKAKDSSDKDGEIVNYKFVSSKDGELYSGDKNSFNIDSLSGKTHIITLTVTDDNGAESNISKEIQIYNELPKADLTILSNSYSQHSEINLDGSNSKDNDGKIDNFSFSSLKDGKLYSGKDKSFSISNLSAGIHLIQLTVTDNDGDTDSKTKSITIIKNGLPIPKLAIEDKEYLLNDMVYLDGRDSTDEDGVRDIVNYKFTSSKDGKLYAGTNQYLYTNNLSIGTHTITLTVTDKLGLSREVTKNVTVGNNPPKAELSITQSRYFSGERIYISGKKSDDNDGTIKTYKFESSKDGVLNSSSSFYTSKLSVGTHTIKLTVTDNLGLTGSTERTIVIEQNYAPTSVLNLPTGELFKSDKVYLDASDSLDGEGNIVNYKFSSSKNGVLYSGSKSYFYAKNLLVGSHKITIETTDNLGLTSSVIADLTILNRNPSAVITIQKSSYFSGEEIYISGRASQDSDNSIKKYKFESSKDGLLNSNNSFYISNLSVGEHIISLTVTDENGGTDSATKTVIVVQNYKPNSVLKIEKTEYNKRERVTFDGSASSDNETTIQTYKFSSSKDGNLYSGSNKSYSTSNLSVGTHIITLETTDSFGLIDEVTKTVNILNKLPTARISFSNSSIYKNSRVTISARESSDSDGYIDSYNFESSIDGFLSSSSSFSTANLSAGTHIIKLTVVDDNGGESSISKTFEVKNLKPTVNLEVEFYSYEVGSNILIDGSKSKDNDGTIENYKFISDLDGELYSGIESSTSVSNLSIGLHTISLEVTDDDGSTSTYDQELNIKEFQNIKPTAKLNIVIDNNGYTIHINSYSSFDKDGFITNYKYSSNIDGNFGEDANGTLSYSGLSLGSHIIVLEVTDDNGDIGTTAVEISIVN